MVLGLSACSEADRYTFNATPQNVAVVDEICAGRLSSPPLAASVFQTERSLCVGDTYRLRQGILAVVDGVSESSLSLQTRADLMLMGDIGPREVVVWGLDVEGDVTFLTRENYLNVGDARIHVASGFDGCVATSRLRIESMPTAQEGCFLRLRLPERSDD